MADTEELADLTDSHPVGHSWVHRRHTLAKGFHVQDVQKGTDT